MCFFSSLLWYGGILFAFSLVTFLVPFVINGLYSEQDLKKKYGSAWAVVTGASSGIGRALTVKLAKQGINVAMVALDDELFQTVFKQMKKDYPSVTFRYIGVDLSRPGYMATIIKETSDIKPNLIFNNAGYIATGNFADSPLEKQIGNYECNATAPLQITHHFANQMLDRKQKGAIFFTSSPAGFMPSPSTVMYGSTKSFLTNFASSLAPELAQDGIDVLVVHPSPVNTAFYQGNKHNLDAIKFFQRTATSPERIASCFFSAVGRTVIHDQGYYSLVLRIVLKILDVTLLTNVMTKFASSVADLKKTRVNRHAEKAEKAAAGKSKKK